MKVEGRNIANVEDIESFVDQLSQQVEQDEAKKWFTSNFRNYIIKDFDKLEQIKVASDTDPQWKKNAIERGDEIYDVQLDDPELVDIASKARDLFNSGALTTQEVKRLNRVSVTDVINKHEEMVDLANKRYEKEQEDKALSDVKKTFADQISKKKEIKVIWEAPSEYAGFKVIQLLSNASKDLEGSKAILSHCVGGGCYDNETILSLRDPSNIPLGTMQVSPPYKVTQFKGWKNGPIKEIYWPVARLFFETTPYELTSDFDKIGLRRASDGSLYDTLTHMEYDNEIHTIEGFSEKYWLENKLPDIIKGDYLLDAPVGYMPDNLKEVQGDFKVTSKNITQISKSLEVVGGHLDISNTRIKELPPKLRHIEGDLRANGSQIEKLPAPLEYIGGDLSAGLEFRELNDRLKHIGGDLRARGHSGNRTDQPVIRRLPKALQYIGKSLDLSDNQLIRKLPEGLAFIGGDLILENSAVVALPKALKAIGGALKLRKSSVIELPSIKISGNLDISESKIKKLPSNLIVDTLNLKDSDIAKLPKNLKITKWLNIQGTNITEITDDLVMEGHLYGTNSKIAKIPKGFHFFGDLVLENCPIQEIPSGVAVDGDLDLTNTKIKRLYSGLKVGNDLWLSRCPIAKLPPNLHVGDDLVIDGTNISELPTKLVVEGDLNMTETPLSKKPQSYFSKKNLATLHIKIVGDIDDDVNIVKPFIDIIP